MQIAIQIIILGHFMHQNASESKNKRFSKSKMAAILPKYGKKTQKIMQITIQIIILDHFMHQNASESKNERFSKSKMATILLKYGKNAILIFLLYEAKNTSNVVLQLMTCSSLNISSPKVTLHTRKA